MILGTHNTMSYRSPKQWYLKPFFWMARCQSVDYKMQHEKFGAECFDLRLYWNKKGELEFVHNRFRYDASDFHEILEYCNQNKMHVRMMLDIRHKDKYVQINEQRFKDVCKEIEEKYPDITFLNGRSLLTCKTVYDFNNNISEIGFYSSVTPLFSNWTWKFLPMIDDWFPWIYSRIHNKKQIKESLEKYKDENVCVHFDFINIQ